LYVFNVLNQCAKQCLQRERKVFSAQRSSVNKCLDKSSSAIGFDFFAALDSFQQSNATRVHLITMDVHKKDSLECCFVSFFQQCQLFATTTCCAWHSNLFKHCHRRCWAFSTLSHVLKASVFFLAAELRNNKRRRTARVRQIPLPDDSTTVFPNSP
jgi:hypothetical protein